MGTPISKRRTRFAVDGMEMENALKAGPGRVCGEPKEGRGGAAWKMEKIWSLLQGFVQFTLCAASAGLKSVEATRVLRKIRLLTANGEVDRVSIWWTSFSFLHFNFRFVAFEWSTVFTPQTGSHE